MKARKVSDVMFPYIRAVLDRDAIPYTFQKTEDGFLFVTPLGNRGFTEVVEDALCEKQRNETQSRIPVYSLRTFKNAPKLKRLQRMNGKGGFHILRNDYERFEKEYVTQ